MGWGCCFHSCDYLDHRLDLVDVGVRPILSHSFWIRVSSILFTSLIYPERGPIYSYGQEGIALYTHVAERGGIYS